MYRSVKNNEDLYEILSSEGRVILNHNERPFPPLSENIARNLVEDLNAIAERNDANGDEMRESFAYCVLASLMEYEANDATAELNIDLQLEWDRLFRLNIPENGGQFELKCTQEARDYFKDNWSNHGLNYCRSLEQMEEAGVERISGELAGEVKVLVEGMNMAQIIAADILYNFFDHFSITIPVLWVSGKIREQHFIGAYYGLAHAVDIETLSEEEYEEPRFLMNRMLYLKTVLWGYQWKDKTLPGVYL